jgi:hypothetical protein
MKKCFQCKIEKDYSLFYKNKAMKDGYSGLCKECQLSNERKNNQKARDWIVSLKKECSICKESRYWCLDFHHIDPSKKTINISEYSISGTASFETKKKKISEELENCIVVCANCHRDIHYKINLVRSE